MNTELFIARRIVSGKEKKNISRPIIKISIIGIALGLVVMILTIAIVTGFKKEIRDRISGFGGHIIVSNYELNTSYESSPINRNQDFLPKLTHTPGIHHLQEYATKAGILKTDEDMEGILLKGVGTNFDWGYLSRFIVEGNPIVYSDSAKSNEVLISSSMAKLLRLHAGDNILVYFIQEPLRVRKFIISGIYESSLEDFDKLVFCDIRHIQKLNGWTDKQIGGFEILIDDFSELEEMSRHISDEVGYMLQPNGSRLMVQSIEEKYSHFFSWLSLFDTNTYVILILMIVVAAFNMVSGLLILILERTNMIGILKALGTENWSIRKVFLYNAAFLIGRGMLWGNLVGLALCFIQSQWGIVHLDPASYYVSAVPIDLKFMHWLGLNIGTLLVTVTILLIPSYIITKISPAKAIRFE
ncbi:MAG: ABC transporter permease [Bacteroidales bacterium]|nr:ABC transporter permease [Bacteroidales bacterium]MCF8458600.1 ABC transporter permease [Bacteroidales bacterium]